ncbi:MAG: MFS transporter [Candidatus Neomarinimicrobiota bacterium]
MKNLLRRYLSLPAPVLRLIVAQLLLFMVNAVFMLIGNLYLRKLGYADDLIAVFTSYRFLGVLSLAFPVGLFIKGKPLRPFFLASAAIVPLAAFTVIQSVTLGNLWLTKIGFFAVGVGFVLLQVCALPFIMRSAPKAMLPEAISLSFATWSLAFILSGGLIGLLTGFGQLTIGAWTIPWDEYHIFMLIIIISLPAVLLFRNLREGAPRSPVMALGNYFQRMVLDYDWRLITRVLFPNLIIAVGAGLTIPFINLFFNSVFYLDSNQFSLLGGAASLLVFIAALLVPVIRRRFGYYFAIIGVQGLAIFFLVIMALTEIYATVPGALYVAMACYLLRQPLMNMSNPSSNELNMHFVGEKNQELISAMSSSMWSAAWYISARIFQVLRSLDLPYYKIFLITAGLYALGVGLYGLIIREYDRRPATDS